MAVYRPSPALLTSAAVASPDGIRTIRAEKARASGSDLRRVGSECCTASPSRSHAVKVIDRSSPITMGSVQSARIPLAIGPASAQGAPCGTQPQTVWLANVDARTVALTSTAM
eukprot:scaffold286661_cov26-Tisochrysis_lutea.AAC.3